MFDGKKTDSMIIIIFGGYLFFMSTSQFELLIIRNKISSPEDFDFMRFDHINRSILCKAIKTSIQTFSSMFYRFSKVSLA